MTPKQQQLLRRLPAVGILLENRRVGQWIEQTSRRAVATALQDALDRIRGRILEDQAEDEIEPEAVLELAESFLRAREAPSLVRVVNATGVVLHTGLGRASLPASAVEAIAGAAGAYCNLEYDLDTAKRGRRQRHVADLICRLTGAEAATVVNNNAAGTMLTLTVLAAGREVVVSRGQLVEIGGSFRLPEIMATSGAVLREVGTTNRTRIGDYEAAITDQTAVLMRVHSSNYRIVGFAEQASIRQIAELAHRFGLPAVDDLGSGAMFDLTQAGLPCEPWVGDSLVAGADLVLFSGDKLLGGPQCGVVCGRKELVGRLESHPLMRTYRIGKLTLLALEATLRHYADPTVAVERVPALAMLALGTEELAARAEALQQRLSAALPGESFLVCSDISYAGGGSLPADGLETVVVQWRPAGTGIEAVTAAMRAAPTPVVTRVRDEAIIFDLRTIGPNEFEDVVAAAAAAGSAG